jgi:long-chain fatty acid transport protein
MAGAGMASTDEAACMTYNPGGLAFVHRPQTQAGLMLLKRATAFKGISLQPAFTQTPLSSPLYSFVVLRPSEDSPVRFGLGLYQPYGAATRWEPNWIGGAVSQAFSLSSVGIQGAAALRISTKLAIGGSWQLIPVSLLMQRALPFATRETGIPSMTLSGNARARSLGFGVYFRPSSRLSVALVWRGSARLVFSGGTVSTDVPTSIKSLFPATTFRTTLTLPGQVAVSSQIRAGELLAFSLDAGMLLANTFDSLVVRFDQTSPQQRDIAEVRAWQNAPFLRAGAEYHPSEAWTLRTGIAFDATVVPDGFVAPDLPEANMIALATGATWQPSRWLSIDFCYRLGVTGNRTALLSAANLGGVYRSNDVAAGAGLVYFFP